MARRHDPFSAALDSLRARVESGAYAPGGPIVILEESRRLRLSTTPVREALAHLAGEGLVDRAPTVGYLAPRLDAGILRERYAFRMVCLTAGLVLSRGAAGLPGADVAGADPCAELDERFERLVRGAGNAALEAAWARVTAQLAFIRAAEARLFVDMEAEASVLHALFEAGVNPRLRTALRAYHRRRIEAAPLLVIEAAALRPALGDES